MAGSRDSRSEILTVEQVAAYLQLNKLTVYKYIRDGRLPAARLGKAYRVRLADVEAFLEGQMARPRGRVAASSTAAPRPRRAARTAPRSEEIAVGPQQPDPRDHPEHGDVSINPMEWVIRGLH